MGIGRVRAGEIGSDGAADRVSARADSADESRVRDVSGEADGDCESGRALEIQSAHHRYQKSGGMLL